MQKSLKGIVGKSFNYKGDVLLIEDYKAINGMWVVKTNKRTLNFLPSELDVFLDSLVEVSSGFSVAKVEREDTFDLKGILMDSIKRVQEDRAYVAQANAVCNIVTQFINVKKLELQIKRQE